MDAGQWPAAEFNLGTYNCPRTQCLLFKHAGGEEQYDMFLSAVPHRRIFPGKPSPSVKNVEISVESSVNYPSIVDPQSYKNEGVDLVVSFRAPVSTSVVSWLPNSYINSEQDQFLSNRGLDDRWLSFEQRIPSMAAFLTNCAQPHVKRIDLLNSIAQHFPLLKVGGCFKGEPRHHPKTQAALPEVEHCLSLPRRGAMWDAPKECTLYHTMFSFAIENSHEQGYVTEKLWQPLKMGAIPIYSVGPFRDNALMLPHPDAALVVEDFPSIQHLAEYMQKIASDKSLWFKHAMAWRKKPLSELSPKFLDALRDSFVTLPCRLCEWWFTQTNPEAT